jgi:Rps23 Pro-64 3,4-dihydroxylase Tpa1-like proline 4-hydroxylase
MIDIHDNVFEFADCHKFFNYVIGQSNFKIGLTDSKARLQEKVLYANYTPNHLKELKFLELLPIEFKYKYKYTTVERTFINVVTPNGVYYPHDDSGTQAKYSLLYYLNMNWNLEWGADTLFLDSKTNEIIKTVQCKPNRLIMFDAKIPHMIRPSTIIAPQYRYSISITFRG